MKMIPPGTECVWIPMRSRRNYGGTGAELVEVRGFSEKTGYYTVKSLRSGKKMLVKPGGLKPKFTQSLPLEVMR